MKNLVYGAGADPIWSEPESAPKPRTSGAGTAQKSAGSATLKTGVQLNIEKFLFNTNKFKKKKIIKRLEFSADFRNQLPVPVLTYTALGHF